LHRTRGAYFGLVRGSAPSEAAGADHEKGELVEADELLAAVGIHWEEEQMWRQSVTSLLITLFIYFLFPQH